MVAATGASARGHSRRSLSYHLRTWGWYDEDGMPCHSCSAGGIGNLLNGSSTPSLDVGEDLLLGGLLLIPFVLE